MNVILHNLEHSEDPQVVTVSVSLGNSAPARYAASFDDSDPRARFCNVEYELFMALSKLAHKRFGDCSIYQMELMSIVGAFVADEFDLPLPIKLGTTKYCWAKPSRVKIMRNKMSYYYTTLKWKLGIDRPVVNVPTEGERAG